MELPPEARASATWRDIERPDWVIIGGPVPDGTGVALLASKTLTRARLEAIKTDFVYLGQMSAGWARTGVFLGLNVQMDDFVMAVGGDYLEALEALFAHWYLPDPPVQAQRAVASRRAGSGELTAALELLEAEVLPDEQLAIEGGSE